MLTNNNSKFIFYNFNNYLNRIGRPIQFVRHTITSDDDYALTKLQNKEWLYFIERIVEVSQSSVQLQNLGRPFDITEKKIIDDTIQNFKLCKQLYMSLHNTIGNNLLEYI